MWEEDDQMTHLWQLGKTWKTGQPLKSTSNDSRAQKVTREGHTSFPRADGTLKLFDIPGLCQFR